ncbi:hypothetical protein E4U39_004080 [Claviceps sp. Clav50 group G5]|nr:hypothetical protein E4U39_004080 [Claviceps sp. Clav50 group G5]
MSSQEYYQGQQGGYPQHPQQSYGPPQGQYPPPQGQYYGPPQGQQPMQYQQAPPQDNRGKKGGSNNCLVACLAAICCCCAVEEGCECWYVPSPSVRAKGLGDTLESKPPISSQTPDEATRYDGVASLLHMVFSAQICKKNPIAGEDSYPLGSY